MSLILTNLPQKCEQVKSRKTSCVPEFESRHHWASFKALVALLRLRDIDKTGVRTIRTHLTARKVMGQGDVNVNIWCEIHGLRLVGPGFLPDKFNTTAYSHATN